MAATDDGPAEARLVRLQELVREQAELQGVPLRQVLEELRRALVGGEQTALTFGEVPGATALAAQLDTTVADATAQLQELSAAGWELVPSDRLEELAEAAVRCMTENHAGLLTELQELRRYVHTASTGDATLATLLDVMLDTGRLVLERQPHTDAVHLELAEVVSHRRQLRQARLAVSEQALRDRLALAMALRELHATLRAATPPLRLP